VAGGAGLIGQALVPYYRQILPVFNLFINNNENLGDGIDYSQRKRNNLGQLINEVLLHHVTSHHTRHTREKRL
jgi:hypothetical protein